MVEWRPIETASKDGDALLLYKPEDETPGFIVSGYWGEWPAMNMMTECWIACSGGPIRQPTHWALLPEPPRT